MTLQDLFKGSLLAQAQAQSFHRLAMPRSFVSYTNKAQSLGRRHVETLLELHSMDIAVDDRGHFRFPMDICPFLPIGTYTPPDEGFDGESFQQSETGSSLFLSGASPTRKLTQLKRLSKLKEDVQAVKRDIYAVQLRIASASAVESCTMNDRGQTIAVCSPDDGSPTMDGAELTWRQSYLHSRRDLLRTAITYEVTYTILVYRLVKFDMYFTHAISVVSVSDPGRNSTIYKWLVGAVPMRTISTEV
jgi:hypothetical protein